MRKTKKSYENEKWNKMQSVRVNKELFYVNQIQRKEKRNLEEKIT